MDITSAFAKTFLSITLIQMLRYFLISGAAFALATRTPESWRLRHRIQQTPLKKSDIQREIKNSFLTIIIYGLIFGSLLNPITRDYTKVYLNFSKMGVTWAVLSFVFLVFVHDTYFYWMHRGLHHPLVLKYAHHVHHQSKNPSPFASQSFHVIEALLEMVWIVPLLLVVPISMPVLLAFSLFSFLYNIYGHLSVEILPQSLLLKPGFRWLNTATHHNGHHKYFAENYGLYFLFWDRICNTEKVRKDPGVAFNKAAEA
jgi:sterol desaturase/sphingolipid hydroxylase (fatty acid hydroxylase superfamily)